MLTCLFFQPSINGHFLEYLHHEYMASSLNETKNFVFVVPSSLKEQQDGLEWPSIKNAVLVYLTNNEYLKCNQPSAIKRSIAQSRIIRRYCKLYKADYCFLNNLVLAMPLLPFYLPHGCKVSGILYGIYRWNVCQLSRGKLYFNRLIYRLYSKRLFFKKVYLLNDYESAEYFNKRFSTDTFSYLPDPINISKEYVPQDGIRESLGITQNDTVYLQLVIQQRKHPFEILDAIKLMSKEQLEDKVFIFVGVIEESIKDKFLKEVEQLRPKVRIVLKTGRVPFKTIYDLFYISNYCFALYDNSNMSSGVLGYASYFRTSVIGVSYGLLGFLINKYNLGICLNDINASNIMSVITNTNNNHSYDGRYIEANTIQNFVNTIMSNF